MARTIRLTGEGPPRRGGNVRLRGLDFTAGDALSRTGERLTPARLAVAAIAGLTQLDGRSPDPRRHRRHRRRTRTARARSTRSPNPTARCSPRMLAELPVEIVDLGILPDRLDALRDAFAASRADLIVTTGGASVGDHDLVRPALEAAGGAIDFWRIALRPGKPMLAGRLGDAVFLGPARQPGSARS